MKYSFNFLACNREKSLLCLETQFFPAIENITRCSSGYDLLFPEVLATLHELHNVVSFLSLCVVHCFVAFTCDLSISTCPTHSCPALSSPRRKPPIPLNKSINLIGIHSCLVILVYVGSYGGYRCCLSFLVLLKLFHLNVRYWSVS